jgi:heme a synthase
VRDRIARIEVSSRQFFVLSIGALVALTAIVATGAAVRLTDSGLGCPDWPRCYGTIYPPLRTHAVIEFSNRAVGGIVGVIVVIVALAAWRRRPFRRDLLWLALALPLGVVAQAVLGGFTVTQKLAPGLVMSHFLLSMVILIAAVVLVWRARERREGDAPAQPIHDRQSVWAVRSLLPLAALVIFAGTATTAAGPHSGGATGQQIKRLTFDGRNTLNWMVHAHGAVAFVFGVLSVLVWVLLERRRASGGARRAMASLCALIMLQGVVGAIQYDTHLPTELVWLHVVLASLCWLSVLWAVAEVGPLVPVAERKPAQIRASVMAPNPAPSGTGASFGQASDHLRGVS